MKIEKSTWFGSTVRCYALLSFRFSLPIINSRCILKCEIMHKWDGQSCSIFVLTVWRYLLQGAKAFTARKKSSFFPLFSLQVLWEKNLEILSGPLFSKITVDIPDFGIHWDACLNEWRQWSPHRRKHGPTSAVETFFFVALLCNWSVPVIDTYVSVHQWM